MKRREIIKGLTMLPLSGSILGSIYPFKSTKALALPGNPLPATQNLFEELGIQPLINARGTMTYLSGSLMLPEVVEAIGSTSRDFANLNEVQDKVGEKIAAMLDCEAAMVTAGAASALSVGTAAAITGKDPEKIKMIPQYPGPQREVIIQKSHRYSFDHAVRLTGIKLVEVVGNNEMEKAINERTVMALFFNAAFDWFGIPDSINHEDFIAIAKKHKVPTFIDAAADITPASNLFRFQKMGFDMITFSGGKMLRAPQSTGLLLGRKDLIEAAKLNFDPYECPIGRPMKINKEEIFGMYVALKSFLKRDHEKEWQNWLNQIGEISGAVEALPSVKTKTVIPTGESNNFPGLSITWDQSKIKATPSQIAELLGKGTPRIEIGQSKDSLEVAVVTLKEDQVPIVAQKIKEILQKQI
ncbi:MAG: aminotransferase class V-fold PLP-dependent enzyme [Ginsengibacter sp.]